MPLLFPNRLLSSGYQLVDLLQQRCHINAVDHASLLNSLTPRGGTAKAVHTDGHKNRCSLRGDIQHVADNCILCDYYLGQPSVMLVLYPTALCFSTGKYKPKPPNFTFVHKKR